MKKKKTTIKKFAQKIQLLKSDYIQFIHCCQYEYVEKGKYTTKNRIEFNFNKKKKRNQSALEQNKKRKGGQQRKNYIKYICIQIELPTPSFLISLSKLPFI